MTGPGFVSSWPNVTGLGQAQFLDGLGGRLGGDIEAEED